MKRIWEKFPEVAAAVRADHEEVGLHGHHDFVHAFRVGEIAYQISLHDYDEQVAELAGVAGLCHNDDRILQKKRGVGRRDVPHADIRTLVEEQLMTETRYSMYGYEEEPVFGYFDQEIDAIVEAVLGHDGKNSPNDSKVLIVLMDADRVVNLDTDLFPRSGQFYHDLPVVDYRHFLDDPEATYRDPKSVLHDIAYSLDWADSSSPVCVRTRLGKKMAEARVKVFRTFFDALKVQLTEEGMHPYPFKE